MLIDRRTFVAASTALVSGCATTASRRIQGCTPFAPVLVDPSRVIRTTAGLRPYRPQGFVVRSQQLGSKRLVHNYGHGGGGITLSWGTAKLAIELGLPGHSGPVAVLGAGAVGLATARLIQEAGLPVTIYAEALPPDTTSNVAGGQIEPYAVFDKDQVTAEFMAQFTRAFEYSWRRFQIMVGDEYGIRWLPTYVERDSPEAQLLKTFPPVNRLLPASDYPFPWESAVRYDTMYVEMGRYLRQLVRDVQGGGGKLAVRKMGSPADVEALPEQLVINCTGLGSRQLFGDFGLHPARGQLAILEPQPEVQYAVTGGPGYMFPRADGILLGGTFELDQWDSTPDPAAIARIVSAHQRFFANLRCTT